MSAARAVRHAPLELRGRRVLLRSLTEDDFPAWHEVRTRCADWLLRWEPRPKGAPVPSEDRPSFAARCGIRERERHLGTGYGFGIFVGERFAGEVTLSSIQRGPFQSGVIGYWVDEAMAGRGLVPEAVVVTLRFAFEAISLHRVEIAIIPRNTPAGGSSRSSASARRGSRCGSSRSTGSGRTTCATPSPPRSGPSASRARGGVDGGLRPQASPPPTTDGECRKNCSTSCS